MISNFTGDFQNENHKYLCMWSKKVSKPLLSKAAKMGQWRDPKPHRPPGKEKGAVCFKVGCSVIIRLQAYICQLTGLLGP